MAWTLEQEQAINAEGTNIIVSAGAGSGKTAVLTERVIRKIKDGRHINQLLILTFFKLVKFLKVRNSLFLRFTPTPSISSRIDFVCAFARNLRW